MKESKVLEDFNKEVGDDAKVIDDNNKKALEKAKKNIVYLLIFSVFMVFAGFSSAYIVSMGDAFWLKVPFPPAFWVSTIVILLSSVLIQTAVYFSRRDNKSGLKLATAGTLILGLAFLYFQFKGYGQLVDNGIHAANNRIVVTDGKYGDYFEVKTDEGFIEVNGNDYLMNGKELSKKEMKSLQGFMGQFLKFELTKPFNVSEYGKYRLYFRSKEMKLEGGQLKTKEGESLDLLDRERLYFLALNIRDGRGDFFVKGKMGKDFHVYYKGKELEYINRNLHMNGLPLSPYLQLKAMESADTSSSFLYILTFWHLLHIVISLFFVIAVVIRSFTGVISSENNIFLRTTSIFWHFLGVLWIYLLLFLLFIH
ncbi:MAG: hypothetical protein MK066_00590 [Crocinitomicaceae bacterium]|nr:hypothetical protein [Crocinitomicaceae bacterium]